LVCANLRKLFQFGAGSTINPYKIYAHRIIQTTIRSALGLCLYNLFCRIFEFAEEYSKDMI